MMGTASAYTFVACGYAGGSVPEHPLFRCAQPQRARVNLKRHLRTSSLSAQLVTPSPFCACSPSPAASTRTISIMKLTLGLAAAFAGCVAASQPTADVYILPNRESTSPPSVSSNVARLIALQRFSSSRSVSVNEIPEDADIENVASLLNQFGKPIPSMFDEVVDEPNQLILAVTGLTEEQIRETRKKLNVQPAFTIPDASSIDPLNGVAGFDPADYHGAAKPQKCSFDEIINPLEERCWTGRALFAEYDIQKVSAATGG